MAENLALVSAAQTEQAGSVSRGILRRLVKNPRTCISGIFFTIVVLAILIGPWLYPISYREQIGIPLSQDGRFGTDDFGPDVFARLIIATRTSMIVAVGAVLIALVAGVGLGLLAGFLGGWTSTIIMRGSDILLSF